MSRMYRTGKKQQLTSGKWEVLSLELSQDKKTFYFTANMDHPGVSDFYRMPVTGGAPVKLTSMRGGNEITLSPDEKWLAIRYSFTNTLPEIYLQPNPARRQNGESHQFGEQGNLAHTPGARRRSLHLKIVTEKMYTVAFLNLRILILQNLP